MTVPTYATILIATTALGVVAGWVSVTTAGLICWVLATIIETAPNV